FHRGAGQPLLRETQREPRSRARAGTGERLGGRAESCITTPIHMRAIQLLRKYNPAEWGGTETATLRLLNGLRELGVAPVVYCPRIESDSEQDSRTTPSPRPSPPRPGRGRIA